jgi:hypothetical protein
MNATVKIRNPRAVAPAEPKNEGLPPLASTPDTFVTTDARGRQITIKKLTALRRMQLALIVGADASDNGAYMIYANLAASVTAIDGEPCMSMSKPQLEAAVQRLDEDGLQAVIAGWNEAGWIGAESQADHDDKLKNSSGQDSAS